MVEARPCPACGHVNTVAAEACASCGEPLPGADVHPGETFRDPDDLSFPEPAPKADERPGRGKDAKRAVAWLAMAVIYFTALHSRTGQTIGKATVGIAVRRARDLAGIGVFRSLVRVVGYALSSAGFFLGFLTIILGPRKRGWHDYLAG